MYGSTIDATPGPLDAADGPPMEVRDSGLLSPSRRSLLLGTGALTLGAALAAGASPAGAAPVLRKGSRGNAVTALQRDLTNLKYWLGTVDGSFGHLTQQAVYAIQKAAGLTRDGVVGPVSYTHLTLPTTPYV